MQKKRTRKLTKVTKIILIRDFRRDVFIAKPFNVEMFNNGRKKDNFSLSKLNDSQDSNSSFFCFALELVDFRLSGFCFEGVSSFKEILRRNGKKVLP